MKQKGERQALDFKKILRDIGHKATPSRMAILEVLEQGRKPLSVPNISEKLPLPVDQVTIYRTLDAFVEAGIVERVDLKHSHAHYELALGTAHHHHIVCEDCGTVEDIPDPYPKSVEKGVLKNSKNFREIFSHSLEFFGQCKKCAP